MGINTINWLKEQFDLAGVSFDYDTLTKIDKTIKFSVMAFQLDYSEVFNSMMKLIQEGGDINGKRLGEKLRQMARRNESKSGKQ